MSLSWFFMSLCFFSFNFIFLQSVSPVLSYPSHVPNTPYHVYCSSMIPQSTPTTRAYIKSIPRTSTSYFAGGERLLQRKESNRTYYFVQKLIRLRVRSSKSYRTTSQGIYKVEGVMYIQPPYRYYNHDGAGSHHFRQSAEGVFIFSLAGFWSEISRKACMVGSASWELEEGKSVNLGAVLKLSFGGQNPPMYTSFLSGTLESISPANDPGYFDPISIFDFPSYYNYSYTLVSKENVEGLLGDSGFSKGQSLCLEPVEFCSVYSGKSTFLELDYTMECRGPEPHQHCSPVDAGDGFIYRFLSFTPIQCTEDGRKLRFLATFQNKSIDSDFGIGSALIGEASWDKKTNQLIGVACTLLNPADHFENAVGECMMRLSLRYPLVWTIQYNAKIDGQLWSTKSVEDSGYFRRINLRSYDGYDLHQFRGLRYEYTEFNRVQKACPVEKSMKKGKTYPDAHSYDMRFYISVKDSKGIKFAWCKAIPFSVGNELYQTDSVLVAADSLSPESATPSNVSYQISITPAPQVNISKWFPIHNQLPNSRQEVQISAEGVYNGKTGHLCMVGCRKLLSHSHSGSSISRDCEILVEFNFAPLNEKRGGLMKGILRSTRAKADPHHFEDMSLSSPAFYAKMAQQSISRMNGEVILFFISYTLSSVFVVLQIFHVKTNPKVLPSISLVMLLILCLGHMIPLVLNFEALFENGNNSEKREVPSGGGWLQAKEVAVRVIAMVAFFLQIRLIHLVWTAKQAKGKQWMEEKKAASVSLLLYISGGLLTFLVNRTRNKYGHQAFNSYGHQMDSIWGNLRSYAGLILDGFLIPQIILNTFTYSAKKALSHPFYIGISAVRMAPHAYDQYRVHNYPESYVKGSYFYANPSVDFYSTAWDIVIPCGIIALAIIVFLQQRHGCRCIIPWR